MYRILLADDEPVIIRGLKKLIDWKAVNAEIVGEAENGEVLIELIYSQKPDMIISDIAMPRATGLDVIQMIREEGLDIKVIFLSGFQDFNYAKAAITYGAVDYLLKPVTANELIQSIQKARQQIEKENPTKHGKEENDLQSIFHKVDSENEYADFYGKFQEMGIKTEQKQWNGVCFSLAEEGSLGQEDANRAELLRFHIFKRIQEYLKHEKLGFVIKRDDRSSNLILVLPKEDADAVMHAVIVNTCQIIEKEYHRTLNIGIGERIADISDVKYAYKTAKFASELYYFQQDKVICYGEIAREFHHSFEDYNQAYKQLLEQIRSHEIKWDQQFETCLTIIENLHYGNRYAAENRCILLAMDLYRDLMEYHIIDGSNQAEYEKKLDILRNQSTYKELKRVFGILMQEWLAEGIEKPKNSDHSSIVKVKEYINEHYQEDINLNQAAKLVFMNPYYFSAFFKKETGQNFKNYLTEVRMKQAMRLLRETDLRTYELAKAVGYKDVRTFTDKFRDYYGDSPSGYKKGSF